MMMFGVKFYSILAIAIALFNELASALSIADRSASPLSAPTREKRSSRDSPKKLSGVMNDIADGLGKLTIDSTMRSAAENGVRTMISVGLNACAQSGKGGPGAVKATSTLCKVFGQKKVRKIGTDVLRSYNKAGNRIESIHSEGSEEAYE